jgi:hypothetical protein
LDGCQAQGVFAKDAIFIDDQIRRLDPTQIIPLSPPIRIQIADISSSNHL